MNRELAQILPVDTHIARATAVVERYIKCYKQAFENDNWSNLSQYHCKDIAYRFTAPNVSELDAHGAENVLSTMQLLKTSLIQVHGVKRLGDRYTSITHRGEGFKITFPIQYYQRTEGLPIANVSRTIWLNKNLQVKKINDWLSRNQAFLLRKFMKENSEKPQQAINLSQ